MRPPACLLCLLSVVPLSPLAFTGCGAEADPGPEAAAEPTALAGEANASGGSTGGAMGHVGGAGGGGTGVGNEFAGGGFSACTVVSATPVQPDEQTALGFSAQEVLAFVEGTHVETLTWHPLASADYGPESGERTLHVTVTRRDTPLRLTHYTINTGRALGISGGGPGIGGGCRDALAIDVHVQLQTDQGALNESFDATLLVRSRRQVALFVHPDPDALGGSFALTQVNMPGFSLMQLDLLLQFTSFGISGELTGILGAPLAGPGGGAVVVSSGPLASWGPARCGFSGHVPVPFDATIWGFSGDDAVELLNSASQVNVSWSGLPATIASWSFAKTSEGVCAQLDENPFASPGKPGPNPLTFGGLLNVRSHDGRIDAVWPVQVNVMPDANGELGDVALTLDEKLLPQQGSLQMRYGLSGFDTSPYDFFGASLMLAASPTAPLSGELHVTGYTKGMCWTAPVSDPNTAVGSGGCTGATPITLGTALLSATP